MKSGMYTPDYTNCQNAGQR